MRITKDVQLGIVIVKELKGKSGPVPVKTIAEKHGLSRVFAEKVVCKMRKAGILSVKKGPLGGYVLTKENTVTLGDLSEILDKNFFAQNYYPRTEGICEGLKAHAYAVYL